MKERGSALLTVVISLLLIFMISGVFFSIVISNLKLIQSEEAGIRANNLADGGIQYGISILKKTIFRQVMTYHHPY